MEYTNTKFYKIYFAVKRNRMLGKAIKRLKSHIFINNAVEILRGGYMIWKIKKMFPQAEKIFIMSGASGDIYLNGLYLNTYCHRHNIKNYVIAGCLKSLKELCQLFQMDNIYEITPKDLDCLQFAQAFLPIDSQVKNLFKWTEKLNINRCRVRMTEQFNFIETYLFYIYDFRIEVEPAVPVFTKAGTELVHQFQNIGIEKKRTIVLSPYANSVQHMEVVFWKNLADMLSQRGYHVIFNINPESEQKIADYTCCCFSYAESVSLLEYAGTFIALRSGLCDIVSTARCKKIILYPEMPASVNYSVHRSDACFSSLNKMGLCEDAVELTSPIILDATTAAPSCWTKEYILTEHIRLIDQILQNIKRI